MSIHTKKELEQDFQIVSEVPTSATHTIEFEDLTFFNFISFSDIGEEQREINIESLRFSNNPNNIVNSTPSEKQQVRVLDYNIGKAKNYAEIKFVGNKLAVRKNGTQIEDVGRFFIEQKFLKPISKHFSRDLETKYSEVLEDFKSTLKENQITNLGIAEWQDNFIFDPNEELDWLNKNTFFIENPDDKQGEIFFSKKLSSYCLVVLTNEEKYSDITDSKKQQIKDYGLNALLKFLNCVSSEVNSKKYYDLVNIFDINTEQQHTNQKIKFLIGIKHRHIAEFINQNSEGLRNFLSSILSSFNKEPDVKKAIEDLIGSPNSSLNNKRTTDLNSLLNVILDNTLTNDQKRLFTQIQDPKLREVADIFLNFKRDGSESLQEKFNNWKTNNPAAAPFTLNAIENLLTNLTRSVGNNFDVLIDETDPYIYFNFKDYENTKSYVESLLKFLTETENSEYKKYLETHEIIPSLSLTSLGSSCLSLLESAYQYSLNKIVSKESISESEASQRINGFAIFLNADADPDSFFTNLLADVPDYFKPLSVQVIYDDNKVIFMGSSKELDFANITNINDRTALFMLYSINYVMDTFFPTVIKSDLETNNVRASRIIEPSKLEEFLSRSIFPYRRIIYKPKDDGSASTLEDAGKCLANQWEAIKDDLSRQTASFRKSLFRSQQSFAKSKAATKAGFEKMLKDLDENVGDADEFIFTLLSNININVLIATLLECLRKKGVPIELILQLIEIIRAIYNTGFKALCLIPPIKLPKLPTVKLDFEIPVVDLSGGLYETITKIIKDLINNLIVESFKLLLNELLSCEAAFANVTFVDGLLNGNLNDRPGAQKNIDGSSATAKQIFEGSSSITETEETTTQTVLIGDYLNTSSFINLLIPEFNMPENKNKDLINEMQKLIERLGVNVSTPDYLNLLTGRPSIETEIFIKDSVKADPIFRTLFESNTLSNRDGIIKVFTRIASLLDQEIISATSQAAVQIITDANALCTDQVVESDDEALFLAKKYGELKVNAIKRKITEKQTKTLKIMERFLTPNGFQDLIPPIKCRLNPDGSITPGILPSDPHPTEIFMVEKGLKTNFDILKSNFNEETKTSKLSYLSTISIPKTHPIKKLKKMYPDAIDEDGDRLSNRELLRQRGLYYENIVTLNQELNKLFSDSGNLIKTLDTKSGIETVTANLRFPKPDIASVQQALENPQLKSQLNELDDPERLKLEDIKNRLTAAQKKIDDATKNFKNVVSFKDGEIDPNDSTKIFYTLDIEHSKLASSGKITIRGQDEYDIQLQKLFASLRDVKAPTGNNFNYFQNKKLFTKLLYKNNVEVNSTRTGRSLPINFDPTPIYNIYSEIYDSFEQSNKNAIISSILSSPLFNINEQNGKPNILYLPLESKQSDFCLSSGFKDIHLLRLENEKKEIVKFYKNNKCFDKSKPRDGSASDELNALERGTLFSYINIYFRVYLYDFYLRGIFVFNKYGIKDTNTKLMIDFFYNIFINDKKFMKIKKITKNNKFIFEYYKYLTKKNTSSQEEAYKYLIQNNMNIVIKALDKKIKKAGYETQIFNPTTQTYETKFKNLYENPINVSPLDNLINNLDILTVEDVKKDNESNKNSKGEITTKFIVQDKDDLIRQAYTNFYNKQKIVIDLLKRKYKSTVIDPFLAETRNANEIVPNSTLGNELVPLNFYQGIYKVFNSRGSFYNLSKALGSPSDATTDSKANEFLSIIEGYVNVFPQFLRDVFQNQQIALNIKIEEALRASSAQRNFQFEASFLKAIDLFLKKNPNFSTTLVSNEYLSGTTKGLLLGEFFRITGNNFESSVEQALLSQENLKQINSALGTITVNDNVPNLSQAQIEKLKSLGQTFANPDNIVIQNFFSNFSLTSTEQNAQSFRTTLDLISDLSVGLKGYSTGVLNGKGIFKDKPNEVTKFTNPDSIINDSSLEIPLKDLKDAYTGLKNICEKPAFQILPNQNKTVLIRQKRPNTNEYRYYIGNVYGLNSTFINNIKNFDPNDSFTFTLKKKTTDTTGDLVLMTIFARAFIDPVTFLLDKSNNQNQTIISIYESIFQPKKEFVFYTITAMCQTSLMKDVDKIFNSTKKLVSKNIKSIINNNYDYINEEGDQDSDAFELSVFIKAALALPPVIIKGIAEAADPNIAFTSKISLAIKMVKEFIKSLPPAPDPNLPTPEQIAKEIPDIPVPILSIPLGFTFPFIFTPLTIAYLALCGFSIDDEENLKTNLSNSSGESSTSEVCEVEPIDPNDKEE